MKEETNIIGEKSFFEGKFKLKGPLRIDGKLESQSITSEQLYIGKTGKLKSPIIKVNTIIVEGIVIGNITAQTRIVLMPTAKVLGNIKTSELIIQQGCMLEGKTTISSDIKTSSKEFIENLYYQK